MAEYTWLFPFEKIPYGSKVVIYGAGRMGHEYLKQILITNYCKIVCFLDKNYSQYESFPCPVKSPNKICELNFDYVILAFETASYVKTISDFLREHDVREDQIVYTLSRRKIDFSLMKGEMCDNTRVKYAYNHSRLSVAIKLSGAVGDNIIRKKVLECFVKYAPECSIDIYSPAASTFLPGFYFGFSNINQFIADGGGAYVSQVEKYDIGLCIANFFQVDHIKYEAFEKSNPLLAEKMHLLQKRCVEVGMDFSIPLYNFFSRKIIQGKNCYTAYEYDGVFDIPDKNSHIKLSPEFKEAFNKLSLRCKKYITINYGNAISLKNAQNAAKQWPYSYFVKLVNYIKKEYPDIKIVQLGGSQAQKIPLVDCYVLGESLELVKYILKYSFVHIDIEGGLVHLATQFNTKCTVLFGPTQIKYWGYEQNLNIRAGDCCDCYGMYLDINHCARGMEKPVCMYSITPEYVFKEINKHFSLNLAVDYD